jgi:hypothetical protein
LPSSKTLTFVIFVPQQVKLSCMDSNLCTNADKAAAVLLCDGLASKLVAAVAAATLAWKASIAAR